MPTNNSKTTKAAGLDQLRAVWARRRWLALGAAAVPLVIGMSIAVFMPKIYRATTTVLVDRQQVPETLVAPTVTSALETRLQTISQEILSRSRLEGLIARFNLYPDLRKQVSPEEVIERMRNDIKLELKGVDVKGQRQATVAFTLSYLGSLPETVALVTNTVASYYIEENLKVRERQATGTAQFLRVQLDDTKKRLDDLEQRVSEFKRRNLGSLPQQMDANLATLDRLQMQLRLNADGQTRARERRAFMVSQITEGVSASSGGTADGPSVRLAKLRNELVDLRTRYTDQHPRVISTEAAIAALSREVGDAKGKGKPEADVAELANPRLQQVLVEADTELKVLKAEEGRLRAAITSYQERVEKIPQREQEFKELSRDYETTRDFYQSLLKKHDDAQIAESMEQRQKGEQFRIIEPAVPPMQPIANRMRLMVITILVSLGIGAAAAVLAEQVDSSFHTVDELRGHSSLPLLVTIPRIVTEADAHGRRTRVRLAAVAAGVAFLVLVGVSYFIAHGNEQLVALLSRSSA